jgi:hypothetical protein
VQEGHDVVVGDAGGAQHLVDLAVGKMLAKDIKYYTLELWFVARAPLFELHEHRALPVSADTGHVDEERLGFILSDDWLNCCPQTKERALITH